MSIMPSFNAEKPNCGDSSSKNSLPTNADSSKQEEWSIWTTDFNQSDSVSTQLSSDQQSLNDGERPPHNPVKEVSLHK